MPLVTFKEPVKEEEPVPATSKSADTEASPVKVMLARVGSKVILVVPAESIRSLPFKRRSLPKVRRPDIEAVPPISSIVLVAPPELMPKAELVPVNSRLAEPEALMNWKLLEEIRLLVTSRLMEEEALVKKRLLEKVQLPATVSFSDSEAGPPKPQSSLTYDWEAVGKLTVKWLASKEIEP